MNILIISPLFAPLSSVGAVRMTSLADYLSKKHHVSVFTISLDDLRRECPHAIKSDILSNVEYLTYSVPHIHSYPNILLKHNIKKKLQYYINSHHFNVILVTCGPVYTEGIVHKLCKKYKLPFLMDFRDLDLLDYYFPDDKKNLFDKVKHLIARDLKMSIEKSACKYASKIIVANPGHSNMLSKSYGIPQDRIVTIMNGYDDAKFKKSMIKPISSNSFIIGCFGKVCEYDNKRAIRLLHIVERLNSNYHNVYIKHVGEGKNIFEKLISENHIDPSIYQGMGIMDYVDGISEMSSCNMFAMLWVHKNSLSTKIFDYLALNKPIVSISPDNTALGLMVKDLANVCFSDDDRIIYNFIGSVMTNNIKYADKDFDSTKYGRSRSNQQFTDLLEEYE